MVKRKAAKKAAAKKPPARAAKASKATRAKKPKNEQLELIKGVRFSELDRFCRQIGTNRDDVNTLKREGADVEQNAMKAMRLRGVTGYNYAGVTLMIVQGEEKLRVIKARDGQASESTGAANTQETGTGQDAGEIGDALTDKNRMGSDDSDEA